MKTTYSVEDEILLKNLDHYYKAPSFGADAAARIRELLDASRHDPREPDAAPADVAATPRTDALVERHRNVNAAKKEWTDEEIGEHVAQAGLDILELCQQLERELATLRSQQPTPGASASVRDNADAIFRELYGWRDDFPIPLFDQRLRDRILSLLVPTAPASGEPGTNQPHATPKLPDPVAKQPASCASQPDAAGAIKLCNEARLKGGTCPSSRHVQMIAEALIETGRYQMLEEEPVNCAESMLATVTALYRARVALLPSTPPAAVEQAGDARDAARWRAFYGDGITTSQELMFNAKTGEPTDQRRWTIWWLGPGGMLLQDAVDAAMRATKGRE